MRASISSFLSVLTATVLSASVSTFAVGFYGNNSDIRWKAASTDHFNFIYPAEYSSHASKVSAYAEAVYDSVVNRYHHDLPGRVNATLNNALYSNGNAIPSENSINLWLTNWDFKIRSSHGWLSDVVTHEFSHLVSIENASKFKPSIYGLQVSYTDYYNERTTQDFATLIPFTLQPLWLAEGTAQYESSRMGFDAWDTHRDMLLRVAALNDSLLTLPYMHDFSDNSLFAELGPYTQGFSLVRYISATYGEDAMPKIWHEMSKYHRLTLDGAIKKVLGISEQELYDNWKAEITKHYRAQRDSVGHLIEGIKLTEGSFWQDFPVVAGTELYGVSNFGGLWFDGGLFKMKLPSADKADSSAKDSSNNIDGVEIGEIEIENESDLIDIGDYAKHGFKIKKGWMDKGIDVHQDSVQGPILAYVSYQNRDKDGHAHFDIAVSDTNKHELYVTYLADAVYPAIDAQGTTIIFAMREPYSTRFKLAKVPYPKDFTDYTSEDPVDIFVPDAKFDYYNIYSPKFSPDGKRIAFGFFDNETRGIAVIDSDGKNFKIVSTKGFDERDVNWLDNNKIVFASNRNGIFNLIEKDLTSGAETPLTNVIGGAFTPVLAGDTLYFTEYDKDGFSLYKIAYTTVPMIDDTTVTVSERDSIIQVADTTWNCENSTATDSCAKVPAVTLRDSIIKVSDTTRTIAQKPAPAAITLQGKLPERIVKPIELTDIELAGIEKDYKPIPFVPLFVPMVVFSENAPDLTVFGDGKVKAKAGLAAILSDPLKKNTIQIGFLLELGAGFDYINTDGLNPEQEKEFFVAWENKSTPLDLSLSYTYANYTSKDTLRYEDVAAHGGDSLGITHYAIPMQAIMAGVGYSVFKSIDTLQVALGYDWANFNLYEDNFDWTYQKRLSLLIALGLYGDHAEGSEINGQGNGMRLYLQTSNSDLYRPGTFAESFTVNSNGKITPKYRNFHINEFGINLYGSIQSPLTGARLAAGGKIAGIFKWSTDADQDTLDSYYYDPIFLEGYPYLRNSESYTLAGTKTAIAELHYLFPVYDDWRKSLWIFETRGFYIDGFAQIGAAWNNKWIDTDKLTDHNFWDRSVGLSFRMSNRIFYGTPFDISLTFARGLNRIGEDENLEGGRKLTPIDVPGIPESIAPTRIKFSIGMGFQNSWQ
ncbi:WD40-like Beta Propeller Repeat [Fibrobacter sp. UWT2]|uniref:PD40 domain-containing protein n=1 Tax=Fibrobacter sp. UWT2 TaxID=1896224 RepID=UPI00091C1A6D|nr:PD40 domain-containing protein [Fibrobacter sp. UWT2]SHL19694.1 WD40-like Beta Propeller Repeat [Fibrobacter sp. UWT2]